jgi:PUA-domain protein
MRRYVLSKKKIKEVKKNLAMDIWPAPKNTKIEIVEGENIIILFDGVPAFFKYDERFCPTVLLLLQNTPDTKFVTVDMGAVKHVLNGADVFAAGIVDADKDIAEGDCVYVRDEKYGKPLAVGIALMDGASMVKERRGKAVKNIHHYGDKITQTQS